MNIDEDDNVIAISHVHISQLQRRKSVKSTPFWKTSEVEEP